MASGNAASLVSARWCVRKGLIRQRRFSRPSSTPRSGSSSRTETANELGGRLLDARRDARLQAGDEHRLVDAQAALLLVHGPRVHRAAIGAVAALASGRDQA